MNRRVDIAAGRKTLAWLLLLFVGVLTAFILFEKGPGPAPGTVYAGGSNLAQGKPVSASSIWGSGYAASLAADGSNSTRWSAENGATTPQWLTIDLGQSTEFTKVVIKEYKSRITSYTIQYSDDGTHWSEAKTDDKLSGAADATTAVDLGVSCYGRYVRLYIASYTDSPSIYELELYARDNLAQGKPADSSSQWSSAYAAAQASDGSTATRWSASSSSSPQWLTVHMGAGDVFNRIVVREYKSRITAYTIQHSDDGVNWTDAKTGAKSAGSADTVTSVDLDKSYTARYVRLYITASADVPSVYELEVYRAPVKVSSVSALNAAIAAALPGETIVMANGTWTDASIRFNSAATADLPVTLKAETAGSVILNGSSALTFSAPYLIADGLYFKNGALSSGQVVRFDSDHGRLTNSVIVDYNPANRSTQYYWIYFNGSGNRVDHSYLKGKNHNGPVIGNDSTDSRYNKVDHSYIKDIPYISGTNGREIFRIWGYGGNEELGSDGAFFTIESNLLENADGEGGEYISLKSNRNQVLYNTIRTTRGSLTLRSGNFNTVKGNFIIGGSKSGTAGIRVSGQGHNVVNNYIASVSTFGINLYAGEYIDTDLTGSYDPIVREGTPLGRVPRYGQVKNGTFAHNTIVNPGTLGIELGGGYKSGWPQSQRVLLPEHNTIANNAIKTNNVRTFSSPLQDKSAPLDIFAFAPNLYEGNIVHGGANALNPVPSSGIATADPLLSPGSDGLYRPSGTSPVVNSAAGSYAADDMDGQPRSANDIGADEYMDSNALKLRKPLTASDVGTSWLVQ